ncbi:MAG: YlxR family protein [Synergistaceae bacterium]|nr:YlxR family protein [Synergistaceae bacterium]
MSAAEPEKVIAKKKRPRTCVGCGEESPKRALLRVVRRPDGTVGYDPTGRASGRGAYVCSCRECIEKARKRNALARALKAMVGMEIYDALSSICAEDEAKGR